jgi:hypothetical protein
VARDAPWVKSQKSSREGFRYKEERKSGGREMRTSKIVFSLLGSTLQGLEEARGTLARRVGDIPQIAGFSERGATAPPAARLEARS